MRQDLQVSESVKMSRHSSVIRALYSQNGLNQTLLFDILETSCGLGIGAIRYDRRSEKSTTSQGKQTLNPKDFLTAQKFLVRRRLSLRGNDN